MAILSWGRCNIQHTPSVNGAPAADANWTTLDVPKMDSTKLTATAGEEKTAYEEGGGIVDVRYGKTTYQVEFDIYGKKGSERPFEDIDGVIAGEHALRIVPEDTSCPGVQIDRCVLRCEDSFTSADGLILHYVGKVLIPATGKSVKPYTATQSE